MPDAFAHFAAPAKTFARGKRVAPPALRGTHVAFAFLFGAAPTASSRTTTSSACHVYGMLFIVFLLVAAFTPPALQYNTGAVAYLFAVTSS